MSDVMRKPSTRTAFAEQFRFLGLSMRGEVLVLAGLLVFLSIGIGVAIWQEETIVDFRTDNHLLFGLLGALLPFAVWKGRDRLADGAFLTLPVEHRQHALLRVLAGWVWLMIVVSALLLWMAILVVASGGTFGANTTRFVLENARADALVNASALREVAWTTPGWQWFLPFTGSTIAYAIVSAINLSTKHPVRVVGGVGIAVLLLGLATGEQAFDWLRIVLHPVLVHPWGLDTALSGGSDSLKTVLTVNLTGPTTVWRELPTLGAWIGATFLWFAISAGALWAATLRFRER